MLRMFMFQHHQTFTPECMAVQCMYRSLFLGGIVTTVGVIHIIRHTLITVWDGTLIGIGIHRGTIIIHITVTIGITILIQDAMLGITSHITPITEITFRNIEHIETLV